MPGRLRRPFERVYERLLERELAETPTHVAVIQDGNRRYADKQGADPTDGHRAGAKTTESLLEWCADLGVRELTLYAFSTENFERPAHEREALFDIAAEKLREFADAERIHEEGVCVRVIGDRTRLPRRVQTAADYAEERTQAYDRFHLNVALAYGGRQELLSAAREIARAVEAGDLAPEDVDLATVEAALSEGPTRDVDLIVRTGGDERTSNFLPWQANGNEAAVYFCTPYWPEFRKIDFLRGLRTYSRRQASWRRTRAKRALALVRALGEVELEEARSILRRFRDRLPQPDAAAVDAAIDGHNASDGASDQTLDDEPLGDVDPTAD